MKDVFRMLADSENYRFAIPGFGTEAWMALGKELLDFEPAGNRWNPGLFRWNSIEVPCGTFFSTGDHAMIGVTSEAKKSPALWREMENAGELLPFQIDEYGEVFAWRILRNRKVVNWSLSRFTTLKNGNRVVTKPVLKPEAFEEEGFLRSEEMPLRPLYFRNKFSKFLLEYKNCQMTGLIFDQLEAS